MHPLLMLAGIVALALVINIPLGYLRQNHGRFTLPWWFYIHISIPLIIILRVKAGLSLKFLPFTIGGAFAGQLIGGIINRRMRKNDRQEE